MELTAQKREIFGKKVKYLRQKGFIPAELYGRGFQNVHLAVFASEFSKVFRDAGESTIINLKTGNEESLNVLIQDVFIDPITDEIKHIDFHQVRMDEKITAKIPLEFAGEAPAVKEKGGILVKAVKEVEVEALPADLPHSIKVELLSLSDIGSNIHAKDLKIEGEVKLLIDPETVVAAVIEPVKEEEVKAEIKVEDVKVEGEEKRIERKAEESEKEE